MALAMITSALMTHMNALWPHVQITPIFATMGK